MSRCPYKEGSWAGLTPSSSSGALTFPIEPQLGRGSVTSSLVFGQSARRMPNNYNAMFPSLSFGGVCRQNRLTWRTAMGELEQDTENVGL